jgi:hypothetical protein
MSHAPRERGRQQAKRRTKNEFISKSGGVGCIAWLGPRFSKESLLHFPNDLRGEDIMFVQYQERKIVGQNLFWMTVHKVDDHLILMRLMIRE